MSPITDPSTVLFTITTKDEQSVQVERKVLERSRVLRDMLADLDGDTSTPIPISEVDMATMTKVIEWCEHYKDEPPVKDKDADTNACKKSTDIEEWDQRFIQVDQEMLFDIVMAANYLEILDLLEVGTKTIANMIKSKTPDELREAFNVKEEFTAEDEEHIRRENEWTEEK